MRGEEVKRDLARSDRAWMGELVAVAAVVVVVVVG